MENPFFSLITICKNSSNHIDSCLKSIYEQNFEDFEHIIFDGKSDDNTIEIIKRYNYKNTKIYIQEDKGIYDALNKAIMKCSGKYIIIIHSDDELYDKYILEKLHEKIALKKYPSIVITNIVYINKKGNVVRNWKAEMPTYKKLYRGWMAPHTGLVMTKETIKSIGNYDINLKISADYEFELKLFKSHLEKVKIIDITLIKMKTGGISNRNIKSLITKTIEDGKVMKRNNINPLFGLFYKNYSKLNQFYCDF